MISCQVSVISHQLSVVSCRGDRRGGRRLGRDQPGLHTGIEATADASRHGDAAENIAIATKGIGTGIVMPPASLAGLTRPVEFDNCVERRSTQARKLRWASARRRRSTSKPAHPRSASHATTPRCAFCSRCATKPTASRNTTTTCAAASGRSTRI